MTTRNSASEDELLGGVRAAAIIENRPYMGKDELVQKNIIPPAVKDKIIAKRQ